MKNKLLKTAVLALASAAVVAHSAKASSFTINDGDLVLGVEATAGGTGVSTTGGTQDYMVDLGQYTQFLPTATINFGTLGTVSASDINSIFSATNNSYLTSNSVYFGVIGVANNDNAAVAGGAPAGINKTYDDTVFATQTSVPSVPTTGQLNGPANDALSLENNTLTAIHSGGVSTDIAKSSNESFTFNETSYGPGYFQLGTAGEVSFGSGSSLNLYELSPAGDTSGANTVGSEELLGSFSFTNGDLVFTGADLAATAPEPSTYALCLGSIALLWAFARRRTLLS
jgi:hypothetical protein